MVTKLVVRAVMLHVLANGPLEATCRERIEAAMQADTAGAGQLVLLKLCFVGLANQKRTTNHLRLDAVRTRGLRLVALVVLLALFPPLLQGPCDPVVRCNLKRAVDDSADDASSKRTLPLLAISISALREGMVYTTTIYDSISRNAEFDLPP